MVTITESDFLISQCNLNLNWQNQFYTLTIFNDMSINSCRVLYNFEVFSSGWSSCSWVWRTSWSSCSHCFSRKFCRLLRNRNNAISSLWCIDDLPLPGSNWPNLVWNLKFCWQLFWLFLLLFCYSIEMLRESWV